MLEDKKATDIRTLYVGAQTSVTDYFVFASGSSTPHIKALFDDVHVRLKQDGFASYRRAGDPEGGWMVVDYVDVVVHIFLPDVRAYYDLESLWTNLPPEDVSSAGDAAPPDSPDSPDSPTQES